MIKLNELAGTKTWSATSNHGAYNTLVFNVIKELEDAKKKIYGDSKKVPTIGIGFNLQQSNVREKIFSILGLVDLESKTDKKGVALKRDYKAQVMLQLEGDITEAKITAINVIMKAAMKDYDLEGTVKKHGATRETFTITVAEMKPLFADIMVAQKFEDEIDKFERRINDSSIKLKLSRERAALLSVVFNGGPDALGEGLEEAFKANDRADVWLEIRYRTNPKTDKNGALIADRGGMAKRRYVESSLFGLYSELGDKPADITQALAAFRMATRYEKRIEAYEKHADTGKASVFSDANSAAKKINANAKVKKLREHLRNGGESAFELIKKEYVDFSNIIPDFVKGIEAAQYTGALKTVKVDEIWVAPHKVARDPNEVAAHTVDRTKATAKADLIFGNIDEGGKNGLKDLGGDDTLKGGGGNDIFVGGKGKDIMIGGAGEDTVTYHKSTAGITIALDGSAGTGGQAAGDKLTGIENIIGSDHDDKITGDAGNNVLYGGKGKDTLKGGKGNDILIGGAGDDTLEGGSGNDVFVGGKGNDTLIGGAGEDTAAYHASTEAITITLDGSAGTGGQAAGDRLTGIENIIGSDHDDKITGDAGNNALYGGKGEDILKGGSGDDKLYGDDDQEKDILTGGDGRDYFYVGHLDVVNDAESGDKIYFEKILLKGAKENDQGEYVQDDVRYTVEGNDLIVRKGNSSFT